MTLDLLARPRARLNTHSGPDGSRPTPRAFLGSGGMILSTVRVRWVEVLDVLKCAKGGGG